MKKTIYCCDICLKDEDKLELQQLIIGESRFDDVCKVCGEAIFKFVMELKFEKTESVEKKEKRIYSKSKPKIDYSEKSKQDLLKLMDETPRKIEYFIEKMEIKRYTIGKLLKDLSDSGEIVKVDLKPATYVKKGVEVKFDKRPTTFSVKDIGKFNPKPLKKPKKINHLVVSDETIYCAARSREMYESECNKNVFHPSCKTCKLGEKQ